jgi:hypothetical protein
VSEPKRMDMPATDKPRSRNLKLTDAEWDALDRIARHHGCDWAGVPSRTEAARLLIRRELERIAAPYS